MKRKHIINQSRNCDFISSLPDEICSHIVSFLPMKDSVATSILSRSWRFIWASSTSLDFDFSHFLKMRGRKAAFTEFVDRGIKLHQGSKLRRLRVSLEGYEGYEPRLEEWVSYAVSCNVEELNLQIPKGKIMKLPDCIFTCKSITVLKLHACDYKFDLPTPSGLRSLKTLHLTSIALLGGEFLSELFSNCLLLEDLLFGQCGIDDLDIRATKLKSLTISRCCWVSTLVEIKISAPCLESFEYIGDMAKDHCFENLSCLTEAVLDLNGPVNLFNCEECQLRLIKLLEMLGNARALMLSSWCIEYLSRMPDLPHSLQAQGYNVKHLVLIFDARQDNFRQLTIPIFMSYLNLETLVVQITPSQSWRRPSEEEHWAYNCHMLRHVKIVKLEYIDVMKTGLKFVKFLLKNARDLEKMIIVPSNDDLEQMKFRRTVSTFRRASPNVVVSYCNSI